MRTPNFHGSCAVTMLGCCLLLSACSSGDDSAAVVASDAGVDGGGKDDGEDGLMISLDDGMLEGDVVGESRRFLKIPFAKPPVGELRWKAPVANEAWTGVRHETEFAKPCAQNANSQGPASTNEDCLYLNVWAPRKANAAPVMVWIHGGGNFAGSAGDKVPVPSVAEADKPLFYDGQFFASRHGIVLVSLNYRLGPLGFFAHADLEGEKSPMGNQGLLDQRRALEWVRDNIAAFGGDPKNVTIFGESAGSADVCLHVVSPGSRGLFHRAISESGGCTTSLGGGKENTATQAAMNGHAFAKLLGCDDPKAELACLRDKPIADIMKNAMQPDPVSGDMANAIRFGPTVDGAFLPDQPRTLFEAGKIAKVPYLLGSNNDEGKLFVLTATVTNEKEYLAALTKQFGDAADRVAAQYPASDFDGDFHAALARVVGDSGLGCGTDDTARHAAKAGLAVYAYNFNMAWQIAASVLGASHGSEISHVFGSPYMPSDDDLVVSDAMNEYWANFATSGDPNGADSPAKWPSFDPEGAGGDKRLALEASFDVLTDFRHDECAFWRGLYEEAFTK